MVLKRVLPMLLLQDEGLVKTKKFRDPVYIGDPINAVRIFNEKEVDELILLDITATREQRDPHYAWIRDIVSECFMPIGYGGGITNLQQIRTLYDTGVEKVIINSAASDTELIRNAASVYGNQAIVVSIDVRKSFFGTYSAYTHNGTRKLAATPEQLAINAVEAGAGEIMIQSIDQEGTMTGFDIEITRRIAAAVDVPVIAGGGAGSEEHIREVMDKSGVDAVAIGSMCVYMGKHRAVLINYPNPFQTQTA